MAWHERSLALEAQVRVTLLDVEGELCMGHGTAGAPHQGRQGRLAQGLYPGWVDPGPNACGLPGPAEGFGHVQLRDGMPEAAERGRKMTNASSTFQHGMSLERAYGAARGERSHRITQ